MDLLSTEKLSDPEVAAELIKIDELILAIKQIQNVPDNHRLSRITEILGKIDDDRDGAIKIEDVLKVVELIGKEDIKLSKTQLNELIELMEKEEVLEVEEQIQKALEKESVIPETLQPHDVLETVENTPKSFQTLVESKISLNNSKSTNDGKNTKTNESSIIETEGSRDPSIRESSESIRKTPITSNVSSTSKKAERSKQL